MVKLWDTNSFQTSDELSTIEPYYTLRQHSGPLFAVTGTIQNPIGNIDAGFFLYTAGSEGTIQMWTIPMPGQRELYSAIDDKPFCVGSWNAHSEPVWELLYHHRENLLISSSSDGFIKAWKTFQEDDEGEVSQRKNKLDRL